MTEFVLVIDQGTTSTRAMVFNDIGEVISLAQQELPQSFPREGWVEHDPTYHLGTRAYPLSGSH